MGSSARNDNIAAGEFDYIIIGGGTAGSLLANRLSRDPRTRVLVLEAGGRDNWIWFHIPIGYLYAIGNPRSDWCFRTESVPGLNGRVIDYARGKVIGGCTSINAMLYMRGQRSDYDAWRTMGLPGWGWDDVLPIFTSHEDHFAGSGPLHGAGGEWRVEQPRVRWQILDAVQMAGGEIGILPVDDFNTGDNEGSGYFHVNQRKGARWSAATAFLKPALKRRNLELRLNAHVRRVIIERGRAVGVEYQNGGRRFSARARREVLLAAGAVASPQILQLSGVGPAALLRAHGIVVVRDLPGVGENLQDHLQLRLVYKVQDVITVNQIYRSPVARTRAAIQYGLFRTGALTMPPSQFGMFTRSSPEHATANIEFHIQPLSLEKFGEPLHDFPAFTISVCNLRPTSRGHIRIKSNGATDGPAIQPNYLATDADRRVAVESLLKARSLAHASALARFHPQEYLPGAHIQTEGDLLRAAGDIGATIFHPVGTAKMGSENDPMAVLDHRLRVRGVDALRVIDASAMPLITSGNTASPTLMIAEKGAKMVTEDA